MAVASQCDGQTLCTAARRHRKKPIEKNETYRNATKEQPTMGKKSTLRRSSRRKVEPSSSEEEKEEELKVLEQHDGSSSDDASSSENEEEDALRADGYGDEDSSSDDDGGASDDGSEGEDGDASESDDGRIEKQIYTGDESCTLDLRNLTAINSHQVNTATLYKQADDQKKGKKKKKKKNADADPLAAMGDKIRATIPPTDTTTIINEDQLLETAREGCQQILKGLWSLETEKTDAGPMGLLPQQFEIKTPRELVSIYLTILGLGSRVNYVLMVSLIYISPPSLFMHYSAPSASQAGDQVGEVCQGARHSHQQGETIAQGVG